MKELDGKVAVVTGAGSGIGRGMALAFAEAGMHVVVADIEPDSARSTAGEAEAFGREAIWHETDVTDRASLGGLADRVYDAFGETHILCNNAGVTTFGMMTEPLSDSDWDWVLSVNLHGVVNGLQAFLPRMLAQPGEKHIVNTASIAGLMPTPLVGPYVASKYAVVGLTETLRLEGAGAGLGCTVLCPGNVRTRLADSDRNRPGGPAGEPSPATDYLAAAIEAGADPIEVGRRVRRAVEDDDLYVFTHAEHRNLLAARFDAILASFDKWTGDEVQG